MRASDYISAISSYVVACLAAQQPPIVLQGDGAKINYGLDYLANADIFPRVVATPCAQPDAYGPASNYYQDMGDPTQGTWTPASFVRGARFDFHVWGVDETQCEMLVAMICEAIQQTADGVSWPESGYWPQARGAKTLTDLAGREYVLTVRIDMPVTYATYPAISGVAPAITTEMDFADGTTQRDPA